MRPCSAVRRACGRGNYPFPDVPPGKRCGGKPPTYPGERPKSTGNALTFRRNGTVPVLPARPYRPSCAKKTLVPSAPFLPKQDAARFLPALGQDAARVRKNGGAAKRRMFPHGGRRKPHAAAFPATRGKNRCGPVVRPARKKCHSPYAARFLPASGQNSGPQAFVPGVPGGALPERPPFTDGRIKNGGCCPPYQKSAPKGALFISVICRSYPASP